MMKILPIHLIAIVVTTAVMCKTVMSKKKSKQKLIPIITTIITKIITILIEN